jgi:hypothetical protein
MPTINQLIRKPREDKPRRNKVPALEANPQKRGVCSRAVVAGVFRCVRIGPHGSRIIEPGAALVGGRLIASYQ